MAVQFGGTKIGAMQYNGVTIGEAMYNGQIVYKSGPPMSGTWGPIDTTTLTTVATYTTAEAGSYTLRIDSSPSVALQITVAGGGIGSAPGSYSVTVNLTAGVVVGFNALASGMNSGTWSVTKN